MIWLNLKKLERKISNNELTEKDGYNYFFATMLLGFLMIFIKAVGSGFNENKYLELAAALFPIIAIPILYKINKRKDEKNFIKRFFAVYWVIRVWMYLIGVGSIIPLQLLIISYNKEIQEAIIEYFRNSFFIFGNLVACIVAINSFMRLKPIDN
jgi:hypothetical protein